MRQALIDQKGWKTEDLPCEKTIGNILNRLGYRLRRVQKAKPLKKVRETEAIFENLHRENQPRMNAKKAFRPIEKRLKRDEEIPKYYVIIQPQFG